jgi:DNA repair protein RecN (Recombination protein N)
VSLGGAVLRTLRVRDFAIIDDLEVTFEPGLNVITGETGAGKTLILRALAVALGGRVDADVVRAGASEAVIEAAFETRLPDVGRILQDGGFTGGEEVIIRRIVFAGGRTRSYVNASLASVGVLAELAPYLVRVYGQHEHDTLRRVETHGELLDAVGGLGVMVEEMARRHATLEAARRAVADLEALRAAAGTRGELLRFQVGELTQARVTKGEMAGLVAERTRHASAARMLTLARAVEASLYSVEGAAVEVAGRAIGQLREMEAIDPEVTETRAVLEAALAQLEEAGFWVRRYADRIEADPERLAVIEARLDEIGRLTRKYGGSADQLPELCMQFEAELGTLDVSESALQDARERLAAAEREAVQWAGKLSVERRQIAKELQRRMDGELRTLGMAGAQCTVQFSDAAGEARVLGPRGWDDVEFFLAANAGEPGRPLARAASGGELSRITLALKALATTGSPAPTLIFDEVDAGIGGTVAEVVGRKLKALARDGQVVCVTHLPQIAVFADHHYGVTKEATRGRTVATVRRLDRHNQIVELARMLGGASIQQQTREHAQQMLQAAERGA